MLLVLLVMRDDFTVWVPRFPAQLCIRVMRSSKNKAHTKSWNGYFLLTYSQRKLTRIEKVLCRKAKCQPGSRKTADEGSVVGLCVYRGGGGRLVTTQKTPTLSSWPSTNQNYTDVEDNGCLFERQIPPKTLLHNHIHNHLPARAKSFTNTQTPIYKYTYPIQISLNFHLSGGTQKF